MIVFDPKQPPAPRAAFLRRRRTRRQRWWTLYFMALLASFVVQLFPESKRPVRINSTPSERFVGVHVPDSAGGVFPATLRVLEWNHDSQSTLPPVTLLHGSPGRAADFDKLAPLLAINGRNVMALDLLGYGGSSGWVPDYSLQTNAAALAGLGRRGHLVGWSNGGGVALHFADVHPERVNSLTLLGSIGAQETEGSGNHTFEHFKYLLSAVVFLALPEAIPHFGTLGSRQTRHAFVRSFWDSDQRLLRGVMERLTVPTLVYHGRSDMLVPARAAETHAALIPDARLILIDANHFIPFTHAEAAAADLNAFFEAHDTAETAVVGGIEDRAPVIAGRGVSKAIDRAREWFRSLPWWAGLTVLAAVVLIAPTLGVLLSGLLASSMDVDLVVAFVGVVAGLFGQTVLIIAIRSMFGLKAGGVPSIGKHVAAAASDRWEARIGESPFREGWSGAFFADERAESVCAAVASPGWGASARFMAGRLPGLVVWAAAALLVAVLGAAVIVGTLRAAAGFVGVVAGGIVVFGLVRVGPLLIIREGRKRLWRSARRAVRYEYWKRRVFLFPLMFYGVPIALRKGHIWITGCCNPGIDNAGGVVGESKSRIMAALGESPLAAPTGFLPEGDPHTRASLLTDWMSSRGVSWPVILKPDEGQRGYAVKRVSDSARALAYLTEATSAVVAQPYIEGPHECGILWARTLDDDGSLTDTGRIFSITRKTFPEVVGDGEHTLQELIERHPRHGLQAPLFLERFPLASRQLPEAGETVRLGVAGNHCQGTMFTDGADLITPELTNAVSALALGFRGGFDYGRFDVRYTSDADLRQGRGFVILELNGITSESTNLYDPTRSLLWAYGVLFRQWRVMTDLGAARRNAGSKPPSTRDLFRMVRSHYDRRPRSAVSD